MVGKVGKGVMLAFSCFRRMVGKFRASVSQGFFITRCFLSVIYAFSAYCTDIICYLFCSNLIVPVHAIL